MARPALSATRAMELINFLAKNALGDGYTMSELAREIGVNTASMHTILNALLEEGYVVRDPNRKRYRLGPSLVAAGQAALDQQPAIRRAREAASTLAAELGIECLASVLIGPETLIVGEAGRPERMHFRPRVGQRLPFMPPIGILGAAYLSEAEQEAWLTRMGPDATEEDREIYRRAVAAAGARGHGVELETPTRNMIGMVLMELGGDATSPQLRSKLTELVATLGREEHQLLEPEPGRRYAVNNIQAPIFGPDHELVAGLTILGFDEPLEADQIAAYTATLLRATTEITLATGGRAPLIL